MGLVIETRPGIGRGIHLFSYLSDVHTQAWWKFDETVNGAPLVDSTGNGNDLSNGAVQERHSRCLWRYGVRWDGTTDVSKILLSASTLQIPQDLTVEGIVSPENVDKNGGQCYVGCMDGPDTLGWELISWGNGIPGGSDMYWKVRTTDGLFQCSFNQLAEGFDNSKLYYIRCIYDFTNNEIAIFLQNLTDDGPLNKVATLPATGTILYNTVVYDEFAFGGNNFDFNPGVGQNHARCVGDQWAISDVVRQSDYILCNNNIPEEDEVINLGHKLKKFDNVYARYLHGELTNFAVENTCFVSPGFTTDAATRRFTTVKDALDHVTAQIPTSISPWLIYIYPGRYLEDRGIWNPDITESSLIVPDYCFLMGSDQGAVIIEPNGNVPAEAMNLFAAVQEGNADPLKTSHIGFANLTIKNCLYGDAIQLDSFIKKPDYPEFRCYIDNVKIVNCKTGVKCEERNSWMYVNQLYCEDCDISMHSDDAKIFANDVTIRQKNGGILSKGIFCEDKKGKIQIFSLDIGTDFDALSVAFSRGIEVIDKAEVHVYGCRIDDANVGVWTNDTGEFKAWDIKIHDSAIYDVDMQGGGGAGDPDQVIIADGELDGLIHATGASNLSLENTNVDTHKHNAHSIAWDSIGELKILSSHMVSAGQVAAVDYYCVHFTAVPSLCIISSGTVRYDHSNALPAYLLYATVNINAYVNTVVMDNGMNSKIVTYSPQKNVQGIIDFYSTIHDAVEASSSGNLVIVSPGTYTEQMPPKRGVIVQGMDKFTCILQNTGAGAATYPIADVGDPPGTSPYVYIVKNLTIKTTINGNLYGRFGNAVVAGWSAWNFENCLFTNGRWQETNSAKGFSATFTDCEFEADTFGFNLVGAKVGAGFRITFNGCYFLCSPRFQSTHAPSDAGTNLVLRKACTFEPANGFTLGGGWGLDAMDSETGAEVCLQFTSPGRAFIAIRCAINGGINFTVNPASTVITNSIFSGIGVGVGDITAIVSVTNVLYTGNVQQNGIDGEIQTTNPLKMVGGGIDCYRNIAEAIQSCAEGETVGITAGDYSEQIAITNKSVTFQGIGGPARLFAPASPVITLNKTTATGTMRLILKSINVYGRDVLNPTIDMNNTGGGWLRVLAYDGEFCTPGNGGANSLDGTGGCSFFTLNCLLVGEGEDFIHIEATAKNTSYVYIRQTSHDGARYRFSQGRGAYESSSGVSEIIIENTNTNAQTWSWGYSSFGGPITINSVTMGINIAMCAFGRTGENITLTAVNNNLIINNSSFQAGGTNFNISATASVNAIVQDCLMDNGMSGNIKIPKDIKNVAGGVDSYKTIVDGISSINGNSQRIVLHKDQTIIAALTPPSYQVMIDGLNQFSITRAAGQALMTLGDNDDVKFVDIDLVGSIDVAGNGAKLFLADHTYLKGMIDVQSGNGNTLIKLDQCKIEGDVTDRYCIKISDADPIIVIKRSYLKGDAADPAIYWAVDNDNVKIKYSAVMHGSLAANNPFGRLGAITMDVASHHNIYNTDPFAVAWFTNLIAGANDSFDPDGDF